MESKLRKELEDWLRPMNVILQPEQWTQLEAYSNDVQEYNQKVNITADTGEALFLRHIADGLAAVPTIRQLFTHSQTSASTAVPNAVFGAPESARLLDLGAGAGFIGISIKVACPEISMTLMESSYRKFQFLNWAAARLGVKGLHVVWQRASGKTTKPQSLFHAVLSRAVAPLPELIRMAMKFVDPKGFLIAYQSDSPQAQDTHFQRALGSTQTSLHQLVTYRLPRESFDRTLALFKYGGNP